MATYLLLANFTEKGLNNVKDTVRRAEDFKTSAEIFSVKVSEILWLQGRFDFATTMEGDETNCIALGLSLAKLGNVRVQTMRALTVPEMKKILEKVT
ncbi:MAG: GYD domain-containing protein [Roseiarcus sp.]|jgi:uncharacterized protein with GYD domain